MQKITTIPQRAAVLHGRVAGDLLHPSLIRVNREPGDIHLTALEIEYLAAENRILKVQLNGRLKLSDAERGVPRQQLLVPTVPVT